MPDKWEMDAEHPTDYQVVETKRGREFIIRLTTGADVFLAIQQFAKDNNIRFAKIHTMFMGGLQPAKFLVWTPDSKNPDNWHNETEMTVDNLTMVLAMSGMIHPRPVKGGQVGEEEPFPAIHFVIGGGWNAPTVGGHLNIGTIVTGVVECFITEVDGIEVLFPSNWRPVGFADEFPENWYKEI